MNIYRQKKYAYLVHKKRSNISMLFTLLLMLLIQINSVFSQKGLKIYISVDMEGIAGVVAGTHLSEEGYDYNMARIWTTQEVNAAIEGAIAAGATEILVNDAHGSMRNILIYELNSAATLITGSPKPLSMMQGIDKTFDAAIFIGYHAMAGSKDGVLDHTYSGKTVYSLKINSIEVGESELNAAIAGYFGVPIVLVSGDKVLCEQVKNNMDKNIVVVPVKEGIGRHAAKSLTPAEAQKTIREKTKIAIEKRKSIKPFAFSPPYKFEISFLYSNQADMAELVPGVKRTAPRTVEFIQEDLIEGLRLFRAILLIARDC